MSRVAKLEALLERVQRNRSRPEPRRVRRPASTPLEMAMSSAELPMPEPPAPRQPVPEPVVAAPASPPVATAPTAQRAVPEVPSDASAAAPVPPRPASEPAPRPSVAKAFGRPASERTRRPIEPADELPAPSDLGTTGDELGAPAGPASAPPLAADPVQRPPLPQAPGPVAVVKDPAAVIEPPTFAALIERTLSLRIRDDA